MTIQMISIVIPTYNEKDNIPLLISSIHNVFKKLPNPYEIIIVDDNSPDGTADLVKDLAKQEVRLRIKVRRNRRGLGRSILDGIQMARGSIIVGMDADMNHDPAVILSLIQSLSHADLVVASRFIKGGGMADPYRFMLSKLFNVMLRWAFGFPILDNTSGYYAVKKKTLQHFRLTEIYYGYGEYHLRLVRKFMCKGLHIIEVPVFYKKRLFGQSKSRLLSMFWTYMSTANHLRSVD